MSNNTMMLKRLALRIATLSSADKKWLMEQLSLPERMRLDPMVKEAIALGLHRDELILDEVLNAEVDIEKPSVPSHHDVIEPVERLPAFWRSIVDGGNPAQAEALRTFIKNWALAKASSNLTGEQV